MMLKNKEVFLINKELQSIKNRKEKAFIFCKNRISELNTKWSNENLYIPISYSDIKKKCKNEKPFLIHTHILHSSHPSDEDFDGYDHDIFQGFCVIGIDGYRCYDNNKKLIEKYIWTNKFDQKFKKTLGSSWRGRHIFCDKRHDQYQCDLVTKNNYVTTIGSFKTITTEGGKISVNTREADFSINTEKNETLYCISKNNSEELSCIVIPKTFKKESVL